MIEHAEHTLGDDVVLDFGAAAVDRSGLAEEPAAHCLKLGALETVAVPAEALQAPDLDQQLAALLPQLGAELLEHRADLADPARGLALLHRAARGEEEARPADFEIGDAVAQGLVGDVARVIEVDMLFRDVAEALPHQPRQAAPA